MPETLNFTGVHPEAASAIRPFFEELLSSCLEPVHSLYVIGSAVSGHFLPGRSDVNSIVILHDMDFSFLQKIAPLGKKYGKKRVRAPLIMTPAYIRSSLDVFPVEFRDISQIHHTVFGEDMFPGLAVQPGHLRHECERDLKAKLLGLRQGYLAIQGDAKTLAGELASAISGYAPLFRAIVFLHGTPPPMQMEELIGTLGKATGLDTGIYAQVWNMKTNNSKPDTSQLNRLFEQFYRTTESLSRKIDSLHD